MNLNPNQLTNLSETLEDFKALLPRFVVIKNDKTLLRKFCVRNRNPIWDLTNTKFFKTGFKSLNCEGSTDLVDDHFIQRSKSMFLIFETIEKNPSISIEEFLYLLKKYCSTVQITKQEHILVSAFAKKNPDFYNYESYLACGVKIPDLNDWMLK